MWTDNATDMTLARADASTGSRASGSGCALAVVIPFYKLDFFAEVLEALAAQTDKRFRVYVGDDASPTPAGDVVSRYRGRLDIRYERFPRQLGHISLVRQWNRCLSLVGQEEWVWVLPDDDIPSSNVVEEFHRALSRPALAPAPTVYRIPVSMIDASGNVIKEPRIEPELESIDDFYRRLMDGETMSTLGDNIFHAETLRAGGGFVEFPKAWGSDHATVLRTASGTRIRSLNAARFYFRMSGQNISSLRSDGVDKLAARTQFARWLRENQDLFSSPPGRPFFDAFFRKGEHYFVHEWRLSPAMLSNLYALSRVCYDSPTPRPVLRVLAMKCATVLGWR